METAPLSGGMKNEIFRYSWKNREDEKPRKALARIHEEESANVVFDPEYEIRAFVFISRLGHGPRLLASFPKGRIEAVANALLDLFIKCGRVKIASELLDEMPERDVKKMASWNAMISGFMQNGHGKEAVISGSAQTGQAAEAMKIFIQMQAAGRKPVTKTYPSMLPAYANLAAPEQEIETARFSMEKISDGKQQSDLSASFQIQIRLLSGKTLLQWVSASDLVQDLKQSLEFRLGIPSASQRLLCEGKHLEDLYPLSFYSIRRNASIILTLRLRGGAVGQSSSAAAFSYKDAVHAQKPNKAAPPAQAPKPFLVDKLEENPPLK